MSSKEEVDKLEELREEQEKMVEHYNELYVNIVELIEDKLEEVDNFSEKEMWEFVRNLGETEKRRITVGRATEHHAEAVVERFDEADEEENIIEYFNEYAEQKMDEETRGGSE